MTIEADKALKDREDDMKYLCSDFSSAKRKIKSKYYVPKESLPTMRLSQRDPKRYAKIIALVNWKPAKWKLFLIDKLYKAIIYLSRCE